jgi:hypothetical protein
MERKLEIGMCVVFIDEQRKARESLVTSIHGSPDGPNWPCLNLVVVDSNEGAQDQYGRQTEHPSSVVHWTNSSANGYCWRFVGEEITAKPGPPIS